MAIGDKKTVVMEFDRAVPGGVATLDKFGKLAEGQRPDGVTKFNGRTGEIKPQKGDYTAEMVGAATPDGVSAVSAIATAAQTAANAAQQTLSQVTVTNRTAEVAAEDLQAYVAALPRLLTEDLTIKVPDGSSASRVQIHNFYGSGSLTVEATGENLSLGGAQIFNCKVPVSLNNMVLNSSTAGSIVHIENSAFVTVSGCKIGPDQKGQGHQSALQATALSHVYMYNCTFKNTYYGVLTGTGSISRVSNCTGENLTYGLDCSGGINFLLGTTPNTLNAGSNVIASAGGYVIGNDGTVVTSA